MNLIEILLLTLCKVIYILYLRWEKLIQNITLFEITQILRGYPDKPFTIGLPQISWKSTETTSNYQMVQ